MIRVAVHPDRYGAVAEFFELFKTAWGPHDAAVPCTVLLTDGSALPDVQADLTILFSPEPQPNDPPSSGAQTSSVEGCRVQIVNGKELPVYTSCRFFHDADEPLITDSSGRVLACKQIVNGRKMIRVGYDLFDEAAYLLSTGQPAGNADIPALDRQIAFVRRCVLDAGIPVVELPPCPPGVPYMVCLTHDVDFTGIRAYGFGRTVQGFAKRALIGSWKRLRNGSLSRVGLLKNYAAVLAVPLIHLRLIKDFWMQFDAYRRMEEPNRSTFFLIPFKNRPGEQVPEAYPKRRATRYDVEDVRDEVRKLTEDGWEMGLHGIDAWRDAECGRTEKERVDSVLGQNTAGVRMHWLCRNSQTDQLLDQAGFDYDSTFGYNETVGFRAGTSQVFRPLQTRHLLEVPLHIQDVALFYPAFLDLDEKTAWKRCEAVMEQCRAHSGVVTVLWHMRSLAPERLWGGFYRRLLNRFREDGAWIGTAAETVAWFRKRRELRMVQHIASDGERIIRFKGNPGSPMTVRVYQPVPFSRPAEPAFTETVREGQSELRTGFYAEPEVGSAMEMKAV